MRTLPRFGMPALVLAWVVAGCGAGGNEGADGPGGTGDLGPESSLPDEPRHDVAIPPDGGDATGEAAGETADGAAGDDPAPLDPGEAGSGDLPDDEGPAGCPGATGCPCDDNADCVSGICVSTMDGRVCSTACADESSCPTGWACSLIQTLSDPAYACVAPATLCRPCLADADCADPLLPGKAVCVEEGPSGRFCGIDCSDSKPCVDGFVCVAVGGEGRGAVLQCRPLSGACPCTARFAAAGYLTACFVENEHGRCLAERTCDLPCAAATPAAESCNGEDDDCDGKADEDLPPAACELANAYGTCPGTASCIGGKLDCKGTYASQEFCGNAIDDDCDGKTDEEGALGCDEFLRDGDGDGWGVEGDGRCLCAPEAPYVADEAGDCDDDPATGGSVHPGVPEACDGIDNDCDLDTDPPGSAGCGNLFLDQDGDGFGAGAPACLCAEGNGYTATGGDCDDADPNVSPGASESCNGVDDNCDGTTDPPGAGGCTNWHLDRDGDGFGTDETRCLCASDPAGGWTADGAGDCDDANPAANPAATETCGGGDEDCDGTADGEGSRECVTYFPDTDGDGRGTDDGARCLCAPDLAAGLTATEAGDCDDGDGTIAPGLIERCDARDEDCDGIVDPADALGCVPYLFDNDGDGQAPAGAATKCLCAPAGFWRGTATGDCDDGDAAVHAGADEVCNGRDDDCDRDTDEPGAGGCSDYYKDADGDGFGSSAKPPRCLCAPDPDEDWTATQGGDCADGDAAAHPGAPETCNGRDDDCDGTADEDLGSTTCGKGECVVTQANCVGGVPRACAPGAPGTETCNGRDDDCDGTIDNGLGSTTCGKGECTVTQANCVEGVPRTCTPNPPGTESCNGKDDDCDGAVDQAFPEKGVACTVPGAKGVCAAGTYACTGGGLSCPQTVFPGIESCNGRDDDCDGAVDQSFPLMGQACFDPTRKGVCAAGAWACVAGATVCSQTVFPGAETCNAKDDDCNGLIDETFPERGLACIVAGAKGVCAASQWACVSGHLACPQTVLPGTETCNGKDDDCDGTVDPIDTAGCTKHYEDADQDGYGNTAKFRCQCGPVGLYSTTVGGDCDENNAAANPGKKENCATAFDDDCDGTKNENERDLPGCTTYFKDADGDGWGTSDSQCWCVAAGLYKVTKAGDCDDADAATHPGTKVCGKDGDCDGAALDPGEDCEDGNAEEWDGCRNCQYAEVLVNTWAPGSQRDPQVASFADGGHVVVWDSYSQDHVQPGAGSDIGVFGQRYKRDGTRAGAEFQVNQYVTKAQFNADVAAVPDGRFVVAWESSCAGGCTVYQDGSKAGVFARRFGIDGAPIDGDVQVNQYVKGDQANPSIAAFGDGRFVVTWQSGCHDVSQCGGGPQDGSGWGVYARRFAADGVAEGAEFRVPTDTAGDQLDPSVAVFPDGRFVVSWSGYASASNMLDIYARLYQADGTPTGPETRVNTQVNDQQTLPDVATFPDGRFVVAWQGFFGPQQVWFQRFAASGAREGAEVMATSDASFPNFAPRVAAFPGGGLVLAWNAHSDTDVFFRPYAADGTAGSTTLANVFTPRSEGSASVAALPGNRFVLAWETVCDSSCTAQDGTSVAIVAQRFGPTGSRMAVGAAWSTLPVPAATFQMGCAAATDPECSAGEQPRHAVTVPAFEIDATEVTAGAYLACVASGGCQAPSGCDLSALDPAKPAVCAAWSQARAYCAWAGKRLCTEAEWELAARGTDGRKYPWGGTPAASCTYAVMNDGAIGCGTNAVWATASKGPGASPYGVLDMSGNAWEWVEDCWQANHTGAPTNGSARTVCTTDGGTKKVSRGGSAADPAFSQRATFRAGSLPTLEAMNHSFRCCLTPP